MVRKFMTVLGLAILTAALPAPTHAQAATAFLGTVAKAMGAENVKTIQYSGSGSAADMTQSNTPNTNWPLVYVKSYERQIDLNSMSSRVDLVRAKTDHPETEIIRSNSPWDTQYDFWLSPFGFLKGAMSHDATMKPATVLGEKYTEVSFTIEEKYKVDGYINKDNLVEKVETQIGNGIPVRSTFLEYQDFGRVKFPTMVIQQQRGLNTLILIVNKVQTNVPVAIAAN